MPKSGKLVKRVLHRRRRSNLRHNRRNTVRTVAQRLSVLRRLVLFPETNDAGWLSKLSWFASVALKLFATILMVSDDLEASDITTGSGSVLILGPGDFAAFSPYAVPVTTTKTDKEVKCLKSFPFERVNLSSIRVEIIPSADVSVRGGMYAALLIPIDSLDINAMVIDGELSDKVVSKFSADYDDLIKHPRARMGPVTKGLSLSINLPQTPHNIRVYWTKDKGYMNMFPNCALLVAFSDMAAKQQAVSDGYSPAKSLFEVHLRARLSFYEPSELTISHDYGSDSFSCFTPKILSTQSKDINKLTHKTTRCVRFFDKKYEVEEGKKLSLHDIPYDDAVAMLHHFDKPHLIHKLKAPNIESALVDAMETSAVIV